MERRLSMLRISILCCFSRRVIHVKSLLGSLRKDSDFFQMLSVCFEKWARNSSLRCFLVGQFAKILDRRISATNSLKVGVLSFIIITLSFSVSCIIR